MFTSQIGCAKDNVELYSVDYDSLSAIVSYFYTGSITVCIKVSHMLDNI